MTLLFHICVTCVCGFAAEDVPPVDLTRKSLKPFYPATDKLHRPTVFVRNFATFFLAYARSLILIFGIFTVDFFTYINRLQLQVCI